MQSEEYLISEFHTVGKMFPDVQVQDYKHEVKALRIFGIYNNFLKFHHENGGK